MSSLFEQAIIDAKQLREAAFRNAESEILEKYTHEVKKAVETILEQPMPGEMMSPEEEEDPALMGL